MKAKMMNLIHGITVMRVDEQGREAGWTPSAAIRAYFDGAGADVLNLKKTAVKAAGFKAADDLLERVYFSLIDYISAGRPEKGVVITTLKNIGVFLKAAGYGETVYAGHFEFFMSCVALQAVGGRFATCGDMKTTSYSGFRKAVWNGLYRAYIGTRFADKTSAQEKQLSRLEVREAKAAARAAKK